jgi:hypothetical protein
MGFIYLFFENYDAKDLKENLGFPTGHQLDQRFFADLIGVAILPTKSE